MRPGDAAIFTFHGLTREPLAPWDWCFLAEADFRAQMRRLAEDFEIVRLSGLVQRVARGSALRPLAAVTFDDGFQSVFDLAFPVLRELNVPATVFLNTGFVDGTDTLWFARLHLALADTVRPSVTWRGERYALAGVRTRALACSRLQQQLKELDHDRMLDEVAGLSETLGRDPQLPIPRDSPFRILDSASIGEMIGSGLVELGAHTASHTILTRVSADRARREIDESLDATSDLAGSRCRMFAYPNGRAQDYDTAAVKRLRAAGVTVAVTAVEGAVRAVSPPLELPRFGVGAPGP